MLYKLQRYIALKPFLLLEKIYNFKTKLMHYFLINYSTS